MSKRPPIPEVVEEIYLSILATPKRQRRLRSSTFWDKFGFKVRTKERVEQVKQALRNRALVVNLDDIAFGSEDKDEWVILSYVELASILPNAQQVRRHRVQRKLGVALASC